MNEEASELVPILVSYGWSARDIKFIIRKDFFPGRAKWGKCRRDYQLEFLSWLARKPILWIKAKRIPFSTVNLADYLPISVRLCCPVVSLHPSTSLLVSNPSRTTSSGGSLSQAIQPIPVNDQPILLSSSSFNFAFQSDILKSSTSGIASYIRLSTSVRQSLFLKSQKEYQREKNEPIL